MRARIYLPLIKLFLVFISCSNEILMLLALSTDNPVLFLLLLEEWDHIEGQDI